MIVRTRSCTSVVLVQHHVNQSRFKVKSKIACNDFRAHGRGSIKTYFHWWLEIVWPIEKYCRCINALPALVGCKSQSCIDIHRCNSWISWWIGISDNTFSKTTCAHFHWFLFGLCKAWSSVTHLESVGRAPLRRLINEKIVMIGWRRWTCTDRLFWLIARPNSWNNRNMFTRPRIAVHV